MTAGRTSFSLKQKDIDQALLARSSRPSFSEIRARYESGEAEWFAFWDRGPDRSPTATTEEKWSPSF